MARPRRQERLRDVRTVDLAEMEKRGMKTKGLAIFFSLHFWNQSGNTNIYSRVWQHILSSDV